MAENGIWVCPATDGNVDVEITYENPAQMGLPLTLTKGAAIHLAWSLIKGSVGW